MAHSKKHQFDKEDIKLAELAKALGHPARVAILHTLARRKECSCGDLVDELPLAQATVSQHLKALKAAGLIELKCEGPCSRYRLGAKTIQHFTKGIGSFVDRLKTCCD
ncbi:MAG: helix-turn-helix transcriptional regulator [Deltaproteobacteria bacterium]|nr:helix-turn-helix transcriptional regulator [Deltaproteobacteria bacterium]